jgi:predicted protein tyrosine phosphatase
MTHYCALTPDGNQPRLETAHLNGTEDLLEFAFVSATNLDNEAAAHMRHMSLRFADAKHFSENWTMAENGKDTVFVLDFVRR